MVKQNKIGNRILSIMTTFAIIFTFLAWSPLIASAAAGDLVWDGTSSDTSWYDASKSSFEISKPAQLAGLAKLVNSGITFSGKTISLTSDINLGGKEWTPIGYQQISEDKSYIFTGTFEGNGYVISNLTITANKDSIYDDIALFGYVKNSTIKNLGIYNSNISDSRVNPDKNDPRYNPSVMTGNCYSTNIVNCYINKVNITASTERAFWGKGQLKFCGFAGWLEDSTLNNIYIANVSSNLSKDGENRIYPIADGAGSNSNTLLNNVFYPKDYNNYYACKDIRNSHVESISTLCMGLTDNQFTNTNNVGSKKVLVLLNEDKGTNNEWKLSPSTNDGYPTFNPTVIASPTVITSNPSNVTVHKGENASFAVTATGDNLAYQWYKGVTAINGETSATLSLNNVTSANAGDYSCKVTGDGGVVTSTSATLTVENNLVASIIASSTIVKYGDTVTLTASVTSNNGVLSYQWKKNGTAISGATSATYSFTATDSDDTYSCVISDTCSEKCSVEKSVVISSSKIDIVIKPVLTEVTYGENDKAIPYEVFVGGVKVDNIVGTGSLGRTAGTDADSYDVNIGTLTFDEKYNVTLSEGNDKYIINPKAVTVTAEDKTVKYGETANGFSAKETNLDSNLIVSFTTDYNTGDKAGAYTITPIVSLKAGVNADNYTISKVSGILTVTSLNGVLSLDKDSYEFTYGDSVPSIDVTGILSSDSITNATYVIKDSNGNVVSLDSRMNAGTYTVSISITDINSSVSYNTVDTAILTVNKAVVNLEFSTDNYISQYGDSNIFGTVVAFSGANYDLDPNVDISFGVFDSTGAELTEAQYRNAGTYTMKIIISNSNGNVDYRTTDETLRVTKANLVISNEDKTKVYGDADPTLDYTLDNLKYNDTEASLGLNIVFEREQGEDVGRYVISSSSFEGVILNNYNITLENNDRYLTITPAELRVTGEAKTKVYGDADVALTYKITSGLKNGDTAQSVVFTGELSRQIGENAGKYDILLNTLATKNYTINFTGEKFTITRADLVISSKNINSEDGNYTKVYGDADPEYTFSVTGLKFDDTYDLSPQFDYTNDNVGTYVAHFYYFVTNWDNYNISWTLGNIIVIPADLTINVNDDLKSYGDADPELTGEVVGLKNGDTAEGLSINYSREDGNDVGEYNITASYITSNYNVTVNDGTFTINKKDVNVAIKNNAKIYGSKDPDFTFTVKDGELQYDDTIASAFSGSLDREDGENAGEYSIGIGDVSAKNYNIKTVTNGSFIITKKDAIIRIDNINKIYGDDEELTCKVEGVIDDDVKAAIKASLNREEGEDVGFYDITTDFSSDDYSFEIVNGVLEITKADLTVDISDASKTYGDMDPKFTFSINGLKNGDTNDDIDVQLARFTGENAGEYEIFAFAENDNYNITVNKGTLTVDKKKITVKAVDVTQTVGEGEKELTYVLVDSELVGSDLPSGNLARAEGLNIGEYVIDIGTLDFGNNYEVIKFTPGVYKIVAEEEIIEDPETPLVKPDKPDDGEDILEPEVPKTDIPKTSSNTPALLLFTIMCAGAITTCSIKKIIKK